VKTVLEKNYFPSIFRSFDTGVNSVIIVCRNMQLLICFKSQFPTLYFQDEVCGVIEGKSLNEQVSAACAWSVLLMRTL
jgi:hypothetical protein